MNLKKVLKVSLLLVISSSLLGFVSLLWLLYPHPNEKRLPINLISLESVNGATLLNGAEASEDYRNLKERFEPQIYISFCGVASAVTVLQAIGIETTQNNFFSITSRPMFYKFRVLFGGMTLKELSQYLEYYKVQISMNYASNYKVEEFREIVLRNLSSPDDFIIVNYHRKVLGQESVGHISPIAAYDRESDMVLILDTASHKYPATWVPLVDLHKAMNSVDNTSSKGRGFIEISKNTDKLSRTQRKLASNPHPIQ